MRILALGLSRTGTLCA
jgi:hypothetical protein